MDPNDCILALLSELTCPLCRKLLDNPHTFIPGCGHTFCRACVVATLEGPGIVKSECPQCHQPAWNKDLQPLHKYSNLIEQAHRLRALLPVPEPLGALLAGSPALQQQHLQAQEPAQRKAAGRRRSARGSCGASEHAQQQQEQQQQQQQQQALSPQPQRQQEDENAEEGKVGREEAWRTLGPERLHGQHSCQGMPTAVQAAAGSAARSLADADNTAVAAAAAAQGQAAPQQHVWQLLDVLAGASGACGAFHDVCRDMLRLELSADTLDQQTHQGQADAMQLESVQLPGKWQAAVQQLAPPSEEEQQQLAQGLALIEQELAAINLALTPAAQAGRPGAQSQPSSDRTLPSAGLLQQYQQQPPQEEQQHPHQQQHRPQPPPASPPPSVAGAAVLQPLQPQNLNGNARMQPPASKQQQAHKHAGSDSAGDGSRLSLRCRLGAKSRQPPIGRALKAPGDLEATAAAADGAAGGQPQQQPEPLSGAWAPAQPQVQPVEQPAGGCEPPAAKRRRTIALSNRASERAGSASHSMATDAAGRRTRRTASSQQAASGTAAGGGRLAGGQLVAGKVATAGAAAGPAEVEALAAGAEAGAAVEAAGEAAAGEAAAGEAASEEAAAGEAAAGEAAAKMPATSSQQQPQQQPQQQGRRRGRLRSQAEQPAAAPPIGRVTRLRARPAMGEQLTDCIEASGCEAAPFPEGRKLRRLQRGTQQLQSGQEGQQQQLLRQQQQEPNAQHGRVGSRLRTRASLAAGADCRRAGSRQPIQPLPKEPGALARALVGRRISVYWPSDKRSYPGVISSYVARSRQHNITYDDGEVETVNLDRNVWQLLSDDDGGQSDDDAGAQHEQRLRSGAEASGSGSDGSAGSPQRPRSTRGVRMQAGARRQPQRQQPLRGRQQHGRQPGEALSSESDHSESTEGSESSEVAATSSESKPGCGAAQASASDTPAREEPSRQQPAAGRRQARQFARTGRQHEGAAPPLEPQQQQQPEAHEGGDAIVAAVFGVLGAAAAPAAAADGLPGALPLKAAPLTAAPPAPCTAVAEAQQAEANEEECTQPDAQLLPGDVPTLVLSCLNTEYHKQHKVQLEDLVRTVGGPRVCKDFPHDGESCWLVMDGADEVRQLLNSRTLKYLRALLKGITVVAWQWLEQCVQQGTWLPVRPYLLQGTVTHPYAVRRSQRRIQAGEPLLFAGLRVHVPPGQLQSAVASLLRDGGAAEVVMSPLPEGSDACAAAQATAAAAGAGACGWENCLVLLSHEVSGSVRDAARALTGQEPLSSKWVFDCCEAMRLMERAHYVWGKVRGGA